MIITDSCLLRRQVDKSAANRFFKDATACKGRTRTVFIKFAIITMLLSTHPCVKISKKYSQIDKNSIAIYAIPMEKYEVIFFDKFL